MWKSLWWISSFSLCILRMCVCVPPSRWPPLLPLLPRAWGNRLSDDGQTRCFLLLLASSVWWSVWDVSYKCDLLQFVSEHYTLICLLIVYPRSVIMKLFTASLCTVHINTLFTDQVKTASFQYQFVAAAVCEFIKHSAVFWKRIISLPKTNDPATKLSAGTRLAVYVDVSIVSSQEIHPPWLIKDGEQATSVHMAPQLTFA